MIRFLFYLVIGYLVYLYFIKPLLYGYREKPTSTSKKQGEQGQHPSTSGDKGDYIDYEEIK